MVNDERPPTFCKQMKTAALRPSWFCRGHKANPAIETSMESMYPDIPSLLSLTVYSRPTWTGEGWFFYFIAVYAGAPDVILPSMFSLFMAP